MKKINIPVYEKLCLTIEEAAAYSQIGEGRLRNYINDNRHEDFILWVGSHAKIKRPQFEQFIAGLHSI